MAYFKRLLQKPKDKDSEDFQKKFPLSRPVHGETQPKSAGKPVKIIDVRDGELVLQEEVLSRILLEDDVKFEPVMVVSVVGTLRKGKSFLLNLLIRYLSSNCNPYWIHDDNSELSGFEWRGGSTAVTTGVWMWSELFPITGSRGERMRVALLDTQGTQDPNTTSNNDSVMFGLNAALSSIQIYNAVSDIDESDMRFLELAVKHGKAIKKNLGPFQFLMFLIRDWMNPYEHNYGECGGRQRLEIFMGKGERGSRKVIKEGFQELSCCLLPHPGMKVALGQSDGKLRDTEQAFRENVDDFVKMIFSSTFSKPLQVDGEIKTCEHLFGLLKTYMNNIVNSDFKVDSPAEANAKAHNLEALGVVEKKFEQKLKEHSDKYYEDPEVIFKDLKTESLEEFHQKCEFNMSNKFTAIVENLESKLGRNFQRFKNNMHAKAVRAKFRNQKTAKEVFEQFTTKMDEECSKYIEPEELERCYQMHKDKAIEKYEEKGNRFGPSYDKFFKTSEEKCKRRKTIYDKENRMRLEKKMMKAYREAFSEYKNCMKELYSTYQDPCNFELIHEKARKQAVDLYKEKMEHVSEEDLNIFEEAMSNIRTECENDCIAKTETANENNNTQHDVALLFYRDEMTKDYLYLSDKFEEKQTQIKQEAEDKYKKDATDGYPSYESNLKDLQTAIETVKSIMASYRPSYRLYWKLGLYNLFDLSTISVPKSLFKN